MVGLIALLIGGAAVMNWILDGIGYGPIYD